MTKPTAIILLALASLLTACRWEPAGPSAAEELNVAAYRWRYRDADSVRHYSTEALRHASTDAERAEALNNLTFVSIHEMAFDSALALSRRVCELRAPASELAIAEIMAMKVAQRTSDNMAFFEHRAHAQNHLRSARRSNISDHEAARLSFAEGELHIVASTYFCYVEQLEQARAEIDAAAPFCQMQTDTAQWLYYNYMRGSGDLIESSDADEITRREFDHLFKCFTFSKNQGYRYFEANALQSLAMLLSDSTRVGVLEAHKPEALVYLSILFASPRAMADEAVRLFRDYGDVFQTACALRTVGTLSSSAGNYAEAVGHYREALSLVDADRVPEWVAGIWEQMSVAEAGLGDLEASAADRNAYLDLRNRTREDAEWAARAEELRRENRRLGRLIAATIALTLLLALAVALLRRWWLRRHAEQLRRATAAHARLLAEAEAYNTALAEATEQLREEQEATLLRIQREREQNVAQRAKLSLAHEIVPLLDRILHSIRHLGRRQDEKAASLEYVVELTERIDMLGTLLAEWIQMEKGRVGLNVSTFELEPLMRTLRRARRSFQQRGIDLIVAETSLAVKADRALTLFMLNTLCDNARKATSSGGSIEIRADAGSSADGDYVELSVSDTGHGLTPSAREAVLTGSIEMRDGHGFGLMNCRGIIESYRKTSRLFAVAAMGVESRSDAVGETAPEAARGSRFWFRLPRATVAAVAMIVTSTVLASNPEDYKAHKAFSPHEAHAPHAHSPLYDLADSLYYANVEGRYADAISLADRAMKAVSDHHRRQHSDDTSRMSLLPTGGETAEVVWLLRGDTMDYVLLQGLRNEAAIAALALRDFDTYRYNNHAYTRLYKLCTQDPALESDCLRLEQSQMAQQRLLIAMLVITALAALLAYLFWLRPRIALRHALEEVRRQRFANSMAEQQRRQTLQQADVEMAGDESRRRHFEESRLHVQNQIIGNCLSTIKHETLYYPERIRRLARQVAASDDEALLTTLSETAAYYRDIYTVLVAEADEQSAVTGFRRQHVQLQDVFDEAARHARRTIARRLPAAGWEAVCGADAATVAADESLLAMLLRTLFDAELRRAADSFNAGTAIDSIALLLRADSDERPGFVRISLTTNGVSLSQAEADDLFAPHEGATDYLVCRQCLREMDAILGHPGCRIQTDVLPNAHRVWFTLPAAKAE